MWDIRDVGGACSSEATKAASKQRPKITLRVTVYPGQVCKQVFARILQHRINSHIISCYQLPYFHYTINSTLLLSQVRWNPRNAHILATAHDNDVKIWDIRKPSLPVIFLNAHTQGIR